VSKFNILAAYVLAMF